MKHTRKKLICCLIALFMVFGLLPAVPSTVYARSYSEFAPNDLIQLGDNIYFDKMDSFRFRDFEDPTTSHEVKASDFPNHVATLSETEGYYSLGSTRVMPVAASPGGLLVAEYDADTGWITFGRQVPQWYFNEYTGIMEVNGTGVIPSYMFVSGNGSDTYKFYQSNLIRRLEINADHLSVIKTQAFEAYTDGCVLEDIVITSSLPKQLDIEPGAFLYDKEEDPNPVNLTINTLSLDTVRGCPIDNYGSPVNLVYNVRHPIVFEKNALAEFDGDLTVTFPVGCQIHLPAGLQFNNPDIQIDYEGFAGVGQEAEFWYNYDYLIEGVDYEYLDDRYIELVPDNVSLVIGTIPNHRAIFQSLLPEAVTLDQENIQIPFGSTVELNAAVIPDTAMDKRVIWSVGGGENAVKLYFDPECTIEVSEEPTETLKVYAKGESAGTAHIYVSSAANDILRAECFVAVNPPEPVEYLEWDENNREMVPQHCGDYTFVTEETTTFEGGKWYVVNRDVTVGNEIIVNGDAHLILCNNAVLTAAAGITAYDSGNFAIYAQSTGEDMGTLIAAHDYIGIYIAGDLTINGGNVKAGGDYDAGIYSEGNLTINGGIVEAEFRGNHGIHAFGNATINGGNVTAAGDDYGICVNGILYVNGGTVTAFGNDNGIHVFLGFYVNGGTVTASSNNEIGFYSRSEGNINGGSVTATGEIAGIYSEGDLAINNSTVEASSTTDDAGYGIFSEKNISITDSNVTSSSNSEVFGSIITGSGNITINSGTVTANGGIYGMECFEDDYNVTINGGYVTAIGSNRGIKSIVKNAIPGTGWTNTEGTAGETAIAISAEGQTLENYKKVFFQPAHVHSFTCTTENGVITASCDNADGRCELPESKVTLTLNAPTLTVAGETGEGISAEATLTGLDEFKEALGLDSDPEIQYFAAVKSDGVYTKGEQLTAAPSDAGDYIAEVSVPAGGNYVTASVGYTIDAPIEPVPYLDWDETTKSLVEKTGEEACADYIVVDAGTTTFEDGKWYVVKDDVTIENTISLGVNVRLILCDNASLNAAAGIMPSGNGSLTIYAQSTGESMGKLTSVGKGYAYLSIYTKGNLTINGGSVRAKGANENCIFVNGDLTINGGIVMIEDTPGVGIGVSGNTTINGGTVQAGGRINGILPYGNLTINGGTVTCTSENNAINARKLLNINGGKVTCSSNFYGILANGAVNISDGSLTTTGLYYGIYATNSVTINGGIVDIRATGSDNSDAFYCTNSASMIINGGSVTVSAVDNAINGTVKNALAGAGWTNTEGTEGETVIEANTEGQKLENFKKVVIPYVHTHTFGKNPRWQWSFVDGKPVVTVSTTCSCGETEEGTATVTSAESADHSKITYTAVDQYENTDSRTYDLTFTVSYNNETYTYKYGDTCKLTADVVSDWSVEGVLRAEGTKTFYFPVTGNVTVTSAVNEQAQQQNAMISVTEAVGGTKKFSCKIFWSLPEGAKVKSTMIYRCKDNDFECRTAEALLGATNLRSFNMKLNVRNGQFMYTATNLTSGSCQTVMAQVVYTLNGKTFTIHTEPQNIAIQ